MKYKNLSPIFIILSVSTIHNIGPIIVPCFTILCNVISFEYPTGMSIATINLLLIFLINSTCSSEKLILFSSLKVSFNHSLSKHFSSSANRIYVSFL